MKVSRRKYCGSLEKKACKSHKSCRWSTKKKVCKDKRKRSSAMNKNAAIAMRRARAKAPKGISAKAFGKYLKREWAKIRSDNKKAYAKQKSK